MRQGTDSLSARKAIENTMKKLEAPHKALTDAQGVPAARATTAEEFHQQFEAAMRTKGPHLIEPHIVQNLKPAIDAVHNSRG